jgi:hypothetical protein
LGVLLLLKTPEPLHARVEPFLLRDVGGLEEVFDALHVGRAHKGVFCRFGSDAFDAPSVFSAVVENVGQPVSAMYTRGLFARAFATSTLVSLKKVNIRVAAAWMVVPANHVGHAGPIKKKHQQPPFPDSEK